MLDKQAIFYAVLCCNSPQLKATVKKYGVTDRVIPNIFLLNSAYKLSTSTLLQKIKTALKLTVVRFLPDVLDGSIKLEHPESFVALAKLVCSE